MTTPDRDRPAEPAIRGGDQAVGRSGGRGWRAMPLRARLVVLLTALVAVALVASAMITIGLLRRSLMAELDDDLRSAAKSIVLSSISDLPANPHSSVLPTEYVVAIHGYEGELVRTYRGGGEGSVPQNQALTAAEAVEAADSLVTVASAEGATRWRSLVWPIVNRDAEVIGYAVVSLPLGSVDDTLDQTSRTLAIVGLAVLAATALAGYLVVRASMRPLRHIETTAASIAGGNLSHRIDGEPPSTEVGSLALSLNRMLSQIEQAFSERAASEERMRRFVADASHELRTPLAVLRGYGELYRLGAVPEDDVPSVMDRLERESMRMARLVEDLLALARLDEARDVETTDVDLGELAHEAAADLLALDPERDIRVTADAGRPFVVRGDPDKLRQVMVNLAGNVISHTPPGSSAEWVLGRSDDVVRLDVVDHGPGVTPEDAERIFDRFYRIDPSRARTSGGSGLGLAIVAAIMGAHGGSARALTTPGGGMTVRLEFPAT